MKRFNLIALCLFTAGTSFATPEVTNKISKEAQRCADATVNQDFPTLVKYTHPKVIEMLGGETGMLARVKEGNAQLAEKGIRIASVKVGKAEDPQIIEGGMISLVPQRVVVTAPGAKITHEGSILGVFSDESGAWTFVDLTAINESQFRQTFPELADHFPFPPKKEPLLQKAQ